jgi:hypothetical protein
MPERVNEIATRLAERVHLREIVVILPPSSRVMAASGALAGRLPFADGADISAATPTSAFQGRNHGD